MSNSEQASAGDRPRSFRCGRRLVAVSCEAGRVTIDFEPDPSWTGTKAGAGGTLILSAEEAAFLAGVLMTSSLELAGTLPAKVEAALDLLRDGP